jgi:hypothetical protein
VLPLKKAVRVAEGLVDGSVACVDLEVVLHGSQPQEAP